MSEFGGRMLFSGANYRRDHQVKVDPPMSEIRYLTRDDPKNPCKKYRKNVSCITLQENDLRSLTFLNNFVILRVLGISRRDRMDRRKSLSRRAKETDESGRQVLWLHKRNLPTSRRPTSVPPGTISK